MGSEACLASEMKVPLYDAHNHLQDARLKPFLTSILEEVSRLNVRRMVVNGSCEEDWPEVVALSKRHPHIVPSFGYHPWYVQERSAEWQTRLIAYLDQTHGAVGEIGLDRWIEGHDLAQQEPVFRAQLRLAAERNVAASIHCLKAWGRLFALLQAEARPARGFLLHSYGGPQEMVQPLAKLGAYFSICGFFAHERKERHRETFRHVPIDRLLIETDAPDMLPPERLNQFPLPADASGKPLNHPANLGAVYEFVADLRGLTVTDLAQQMQENFERLFGVA